MCSLSWAGLLSALLCTIIIWSWTTELSLVSPLGRLVTHYVKQHRTKPPDRCLSRMKIIPAVVWLARVHLSALVSQCTLRYVSDGRFDPLKLVIQQRRFVGVIQIPMAEVEEFFLRVT